MYVVGLRDCVGDNRAMDEKLQTILVELREKLATQYGERLVNIIELLRCKEVSVIH